MPIHTRKNLYRGVNAHLHSALQNRKRGWQTFHGKHIGDLAEAFDQAIEAQNPGKYTVQMDVGMQIREVFADDGEIERKRQDVEPDMSINRVSTSGGSGAAFAAAAPTLTLSTLDLLEIDPERYLSAISVREILIDGGIGSPVLWIEPLSPTNKPGGSGAFQYREKRVATLTSGIALVEIDYLHETHSPISRLPSYPDDEPGATAYTIVVTDPRPSLEASKTEVYGFNVDDPIPRINLPLANGDTLNVDFDAVYQRTYQSLGSYSLQVDYEQLPVKFKRYSVGDQEQIRQVMQRAAAVQSSE